ncbi:17881_t:CDS:1, partial [Cetraspora pellucida]
PSGKILSSEMPNSPTSANVKYNKTRTSPDPKWMSNRNDAWLEYRNVNETIFVFCKWCELKNYANELAKGMSNYRKQSIDRHLNHHKHKAEAEEKKIKILQCLNFHIN